MLSLEGMNIPLANTLGRMRDELQTILSLCEDKEVHKAVKRLNALVDAVESGLKCPLGENNCPLEKKAR